MLRQLTSSKFRFALEWTGVRLSWMTKELQRKNQTRRMTRKAKTMGIKAMTHILDI